MFSVNFDPLMQCGGLGGYQNRMMFWIIFPIGLILVLVVALRVQVKIVSRLQLVAMKDEKNADSMGEDSKDAESFTRGKASKRMRKTRYCRIVLSWLLLSRDISDNERSQDASEKKLIGSRPALILLLFFYPVVTQIAFSAFPCHDFGTQGQWLKADVSISCTSTAHQQATKIAWWAILLYPFGTWLLILVLLSHHARHQANKTYSGSWDKVMALLTAEYKDNFLYCSRRSEHRTRCRTSAANVSQISHSVAFAQGNSWRLHDNSF